MPKRKRGASAATASKRARYVKPAVKRFVKRQFKKRIERKFVTTDGADNPWTTRQIHKLTMPTVGTGDAGNRIGDRIRLTSIDMRYTLIHSDGTNFTRLIFFQWKPDANNYAPQVGDILPTGISDMNVPVKHDLAKGGQLNVLYDKVHAQSETGSTAAIFRKKFFTRGFGRDVQFTNGATTGTNQLYLLTVSDSAAAPHPTLDYRFRVNYTDA